MRTSAHLKPGRIAQGHHRDLTRTLVLCPEAVTERPRIAEREPRSLQPEQIGQLTLSTPAVSQRVQLGPQNTLRMAWRNVLGRHGVLVSDDDRAFQSTVVRRSSETAQSP
jgi:hypothetical protein